VPVTLQKGGDVPREIDPAKVDAARRVLVAGGTVDAAADAAGVTSRCVRGWRERGLLDGATPSDSASRDLNVPPETSAPVERSEPTRNDPVAMTGTVRPPLVPEPPLPAIPTVPRGSGTGSVFLPSAAEDAARQRASLNEARALEAVSAARLEDARRAQTARAARSQEAAAQRRAEARQDAVDHDFACRFAGLFGHWSHFNRSAHLLGFAVERGWRDAAMPSRESIAGLAHGMFAHRPDAIRAFEDGWREARANPALTRSIEDRSRVRRDDPNRHQVRTEQLGDDDAR
jgi:hypothetical protein